MLKCKARIEAFRLLVEIHKLQYIGMCWGVCVFAPEANKSLVFPALVSTDIRALWLATNLARRVYTERVVGMGRGWGS